MITIAGAGISGLTAAITLAAAGYAVSVYEKGFRPKPGFETAVHIFRNYGREKDAVGELSQTGIDMPELFEIHGMYKFSPNMKRSEIASMEPLFYSFLRGKDHRSIDQTLLKQAERLGVELVFGKAAPEKVDIIATGAGKAAGAAYGLHYENVNDVEAVYIFYNDRYAPKGYMFVLPYGNSADVTTAMYCSPDDYGRIREYFEKAINDNGVLREILHGAEAVCEVSGYGDFNVPSSAVRDGCLYVGEAAGFQDGSNGFGVRYAILSGCLAAKSIIEGLDYDELWKEAFLDDLEHYFKRRIVYQRMDNREFERYIEELGESTTKEAEETLKAESLSTVSDSEYRDCLSRWQHERKM